MASRWQKIIPNRAAALAGAMALALAGTGCQVFGTRGPVATHPLPDLPRAASVLGEGESISYRDFFLEVEEIVWDEESEQIRISYQARPGRRADFEERTALFDQYLVDGDYMYQFLPREGAGTRAATELIRVNTWYLPDVMGAPREFEEPVSLRMSERDLRFFPGGFVVLRSIRDNDFRRLDDDSARLEIHFDGTTELIEIQELTWKEHGGLVIEARDIYAGDLPGRGQANFRIHSARHAWKEVVETEELELTPGGSIELDGITVTADTVDPRRGDPNNVFLVMERGVRVADAMLAPGQGMRFADWLVMHDGQDDGQLHFTAMRKPQTRYATLARVPGGPVVQLTEERPAPEEPPMIRRTLRQGDKVTFWGLELEVNQVLSLDPTRLYQDVVDLTVTTENFYDMRRLREGTRDTVNAPDRWYVIQLLEARPSRSQRGDGSVTLELSTGTYLNQRDARISNF